MRVLSTLSEELQMVVKFKKDRLNHDGIGNLSKKAFAFDHDRLLQCQN